MTTGVHRGAVLFGAIMFLGVGASAAQAWRGEAGLEVRVSSRKGGDLAGARVELMYRGGRESSGPPPVATDDRGRAVILGLAAGTWQIEVKHPEYMSYVAVVQLDAKEKPEITASFLEASVGGSVPIQVKLAKARGGPASPPLPVIAATPPATPQPAPTPKAAPAPTAPQPTTPQPATPAPTTSRLPTPEAKTPAAPEKTPAPVPDTPPAVANAASSATRPVPAPTPAPEPATEPAVEAVTPEPTAAQAPPSEPSVLPQPATPAAPITERIPPMPAPIQPAPAPEPTRPQPTPPTSPAPEPALAEPTAEPAPARPATAEVAPSPQPTAVAPQPEPAPTVEPAPPQTAPAAPSPPAPAPQWRSYRQRTCPECRAGEWAVTVAARMSGGPQCDDEASDAASTGAGMLGGRGELELAGFAGPLEGATALVAGEPGTEIAARLAGADAGGCRMLGIVLPKSSRFVGFQYEVENAAGRQPCLPDQPCPGGTDFAGPPRIMRGPAATVIHALAHGSDGLALLTVYFRAPSDQWEPQP